MLSQLPVTYLRTPRWQISHTFWGNNGRHALHFNIFMTSFLQTPIVLRITPYSSNGSKLSTLEINLFDCFDSIWFESADLDHLSFPLYYFCRPKMEKKFLYKLTEEENCFFQYEKRLRQLFFFLLRLVLIFYLSSFVSPLDRFFIYLTVLSKTKPN